MRIFFVSITIILLLPSFLTDDSGDSSLIVMTYNIWNGFDWGRDALRKEKCINWIKSKQPDVVALQELCGYDEDKLKTDAKHWGHDYVKLLKTEGYPVGITSNKPIVLKERAIDNFWHGMLHCETYGIDFYVVHLSPSDCVIRLKEANLIVQKIKESGSDKYIILGDFNAHSPFDAHYLEKNSKLKKKYDENKSASGYNNLRLGEYDYAVLSQFLATPAVDVSLNNTEIKDRYTFPTPALVGTYQTDVSVVQNRERIDYILASPSIGKTCQKVIFCNKNETHLLSDHYPLIAEFSL